MNYFTRWKIIFKKEIYQVSFSYSYSSGIYPCIQVFHFLKKIIFQIKFFSDVSPSSNSGQPSSINTDAGDKSAISELNDLFVSGLVDKALTVSSQKLQNSAHSLVSKSKNPRKSLFTVYRSPVISPTESLKSPNKSLSSSIKSPLISCSLTRSPVKSSAASSPFKSLSCTEYKENLELDQRVGQPQLVHQPSYRYIFQRNWLLAAILIFLIPISVQPDGVNI